ncbi:MAG: DUF1292 domain-containing protein [Clostridiales bacterium]|jgi:uncharacterized protein YrzB (UPF0473 family)|nr:DUF1292 domain-containing protein [Clostridiales bacterium]
MSHDCFEDGCDECSHGDETIIVTLEDGSEVECDVLGVFDVEEKSYIALMPINEEDVLIYVYKESGQDIELELIESDEEFEKVSTVFEQFFLSEEEEFDEGDDEEEYIYEEDDDEE